MTVHIQPARLNGLGAPEVMEETAETAATFSIGAPVRRDATNTDEFEEHPGGTVVIGLVGFALQDVTAGVPDFGTKFQIAKARDQIQFSAQIINTAVIQTVAGDGTHLGVQYGIVKDGTNWYIDEADTTNVVLTVVKEMPEHNTVLFELLTSVISA